MTVTNKPQFSPDDVKILSINDKFNGFFRLQEYKFRHRLFEGGWSDEICREMLERGDAVAVIPYDPALDAIILVEQIRAGVLRHDMTPWLFEFIAGMIDKNEDIEQVAVREAHEEAGVEITQLKPILSYFSSPGGTSERIHLYLARASLANIGGIHGLDHEGEDIRVHVIALDDALQLLAQGKIDNAATIIGLQWLALNRDKLYTD